MEHISHPEHLLELKEYVVIGENALSHILPCTRAVQNYHKKLITMGTANPPLHTNNARCITFLEGNGKPNKKTRFIRLIRNHTKLDNHSHQTSQIYGQ